MERFFSIDSCMVFSLQIVYQWGCFSKQNLYPPTRPFLCEPVLNNPNAQTRCCQTDFCNDARLLPTFPTPPQTTGTCTSFKIRSVQQIAFAIVVMLIQPLTGTL